MNQTDQRQIIIYMDDNYYAPYINLRMRLVLVGYLLLETNRIK